MSEYCKLCGARCPTKYFIQRTTAGRAERYCQACFNKLLPLTMTEINKLLKSKRKSKPL